MSNDFNVIGTFKPKVENTFLGKGGGGGNTGYFNQRRKKKDENTSIMSIMKSEDTIEKFTSSNIPEITEEQGLMDKIKGFFKF